MFPGGKAAPSFAWVNDVIVSTDRGVSWSLVTQNAPWLARSDVITAVQPGTNNVVTLGGANNNNGNDYSDVWLSTDGSGAVWKQQNASAFAIADAAITWLPDAGMGTIVLYDYANSIVYTSTNMGAQWTAAANIKTIAASQTGSIVPGSTGAMIFDGNSNLYLVGGSSTPVFWFSADKGTTWTYLPQATKATAAIQDVVTLTEFSNSCLSVQYSASAAAPSGFHRNLGQHSRHGSIPVPQLIRSVHSFIHILVCVLLSATSVVWWLSHGRPRLRRERVQHLLRRVQQLRQHAGGHSADR